MKPQFPYKCKYTITQGYGENATGKYVQHHGALDIVPMNDLGFHYPAEIFPVFDGAEVAITEFNFTYGQGIRVRTTVDSEQEQHFTDYLKSQSVLPKDYTGIYYIEDLYWHILKVLDHDGTVDQKTPIALTGNTGDVYSGGQPVPDNMKGVAPYPGLHLHWEVSILDLNLKRLNLDKDVVGRFDPMIIVNYKGEGYMSNAVFMRKSGTDEFGFILPATSIEALKDKALNLGRGDIIKADGSVDFSKAVEITY